MTERVAGTTDRMQSVLASAKSLEIGAWMRAAGNAPGDYRSRFRGGGIEFSEVREYVAGDDPRRIDWNVSARHNGLYVKEFVAERDLNVYVVVDRSGSTTFGSTESKWEIAMNAGASLVLSALRGNNRIGLGMFSESLEMFVPARKGRAHAIKIIHKMVEGSPDTERRWGKDGKKGSSAKGAECTGTDLARTAVQLAGRIRRKSIVFVISDFITGPFAKSLGLLGARNAVVMVNISDAHESRMPDIGYACLEDTETGEQILVDTSKKEFQKAYVRMAREAAESTKRQAIRAGSSHVDITDGRRFAVMFNRHARAAKSSMSWRRQSTRTVRHGAV